MNYTHKNTFEWVSCLRWGAVVSLVAITSACPKSSSSIASPAQPAVTFTSSCPGLITTPSLCAEALVPSTSGQSGVWDLQLGIHGLQSVGPVNALSFDVVINPAIVTPVGGGAVNLADPELSFVGASPLFFNPIGGVALGDSGQGVSHIFVSQQGGGPSLLEEGDLAIVRVELGADGSSPVAITNLRAVTTDLAGHPVDVLGIQVYGGTLTVGQ